MPTNVTIGYVKANERYQKAKTREEKIEALEDMIREAPSHKGGENLRKQLKQRLAKLKKQKISKGARKSISIPKEGDAQICIIGMTNSGKSTLLSKMTNAKPKISDLPFTTVKPQIGTWDYGGVKIQLIELPSTFRPSIMSIARACDGIIMIYRNVEEKEELEEILKRFRIRNPTTKIKINEKIEKIEKNAWKMLGLIRVYCKEPGKKPEKKPLVIKKGSCVKDASKKLHKDFLEYFNFARIWGSSKYPGERVGLEYVLEDKDILEFHVT